MTTFILIIIGLWLLSRALTWGGNALEQRGQRKQAEHEAQDLAAMESAGALSRIADVLEGPAPTPVSSRIAEARSDLAQRGQVKDAMERELGIK